MDGNNMNNFDNQAAEYTYDAGAVYEAPAAKSGSNALAIVAIICAILSLVCCFCYGAGLVPAIVGIICGANGKKKCPNTTLAKVAMIISIVSLVLNVITGIVMLAVFGFSFFAAMEDPYYYY